MLADSFKFKGHDCFKNDWSGFDAFKPISVIIGRNNAGKSQLLDVLERLTVDGLQDLEFAFRCSGVLDENSLKAVFKERLRDGGLPGNHWNNHGQQFMGKPIEWQRDIDGTTIDVVSLDYPPGSPSLDKERGRKIGEAAKSATTPLHGRTFRRLFADRDVQPEGENDSFPLTPDGAGATNIIRRYITGADYPEDLIQVELLEALCEIFGQDGDFQSIDIRQLGASAGEDKRKKWEVFLHEPEKGSIPLSRSGSGIKTVVLVLLNLLVYPKIEDKAKSEYVFAFEELENNLHPALLRRLLKYLKDFVSREECFLFLTTHSSVALDFFGTRPDAQIVHVTHDGQSATTKAVSAHFDHVGLLTELGSRPSDLLQANGVIWLEGPSDRTYFNRFIELFSDGELREGRDYQCAFYGGSNLANATFAAPEETDETFTNLLRLNNNIAVICDGDRIADSGKGSRIKGRVQRVKQEVEQIPSAFLWITDAKEIENYIPGLVWAKVYGLPSVPDPDKYDRFPTSDLKNVDFVPRNLKRKSFDKCDFAMNAVGHLTREALVDRFDFEARIESLVDRIKAWNE